MSGVPVGRVVTLFTVVSFSIHSTCIWAVCLTIAHPELTPNSPAVEFEPYAC